MNEYQFPTPPPEDYVPVPIPKGYIARVLPRECCLDLAALAPWHLRVDAIDRATARAKKKFPQFFKPQEN